MSEDVDTDDPSRETKPSKRALWKDAISKTKSKFKKNESPKDFKLSDDVNEFLAAGRAAPTVRLSNGFDVEESSRVSPTSNPPEINQPHQSPRRIVVPRLDISQSSRWPGARSFSPQSQAQSDDFLRPGDNNQRSQSLSSLRKRGSKPRNLSVSFVNSPPIVIGEGGDAAEAPPAQISWERERSRSLSPMVNRPPNNHSRSGSNVSVNSQERSPLRRKPVPSPVPGPFRQDSSPKPVHRVPTGLDNNMRSLADQEFDKILNLTPTPESANEHGNPFKTPLYSPKPIRTPVSPPEVPTELTNGDVISPLDSNLSPERYARLPTSLDNNKRSVDHQKTMNGIPASLPLRRSPNFSTTQSPYDLARQHGTDEGPAGWL